MGEPLDETEQMIRDTIGRLKDVYREARNDLYVKLMEFEDAHAKRVAKYRQMVEAGELTEEDYQAWMKGQIFQLRAWKLKIGQLQRTMTDVDKRAQEIINTGKLDVFAENANYMTYQIERDLGATTSFGLYNRESVLRLVTEQPDLLPRPRIDEGKDYAWYNKIITNAVTQGIVQGEMIHQIVLRIANETAEKASNAMIRNVRTAYTGAQNAGNMMQMQRAEEELGIHYQKRWLCILDDKTRDAHAKLDGQTVPWDEPFNSILGPIMYPGDPSAAPANVYNCRCQMEKLPAGHVWKMNRRDAMTGEVVTDMTYQEWLRMKKGQSSDE